jgi:transcriptional regulator with XRE-family HTH domain
MLQEHYPNRLCYLRRRRRLSQKHMAALIGLKDRTMISKYERGHVLPSFEVAAKYQIIFDVNIADSFSKTYSQWQREVDQAGRRTQLSPLTQLEERP